jgi:hypothetical protein
MIEILTLFSFVLILGIVLLAKDAKLRFQFRRRKRFMDAMMAELEGVSIEQARRRLGEPTEIVSGSEGRQMYVWKGPEAEPIPPTPELVIVTIIADGAGVITKTAWESR